MQSPSELFDVIIIGAGPAGITAAIYAARKNLKVMVLTKDIGGQAALSGDIENYPGFTIISGEVLASKFREDLQIFEHNQSLFLKEGVEVVNLTGADPDFTVSTSDGVDYHGKTVIIASGRIPRKLNIPGESELFGRGVATCATCDAPLYKDKDVAVIGGGNSAMDAAFSLEKVARSVTVINNTEALRGDEILMKNITTSPKVKILNNYEAVQIMGDKAVGGVRVKSKQTGEEETLTVSGVFIEVGWTPSTSFDKLTDKNDSGEIEVDAYGATSVPGIYACGDVNNIWGEQIVIAAGEGAKTALRVAEHISKVAHSATSNIHEG